jgi:hypothetical protein
MSKKKRIIIKERYYFAPKNNKKNITKKKIKKTMNEENPICSNILRPFSFLLSNPNLLASLPFHFCIIAFEDLSFSFFLFHFF